MELIDIDRVIELSIQKIRMMHVQSPKDERVRLLTRTTLHNAINCKLEMLHRLNYLSDTRHTYNQILSNALIKLDEKQKERTQLWIDPKSVTNSDGKDATHQIARPKAKKRLVPVQAFKKRIDTGIPGDQQGMDIDYDLCNKLKF